MDFETLLNVANQTHEQTLTRPNNFKSTQVNMTHLFLTDIVDSRITWGIFNNIKQLHLMLDSILVYSGATHYY